MRAIEHDYLVVEHDYLVVEHDYCIDKLCQTHYWFIGREQGGGGRGEPVL